MYGNVKSAFKSFKSDKLLTQLGNRDFNNILFLRDWRLHRYADVFFATLQKKRYHITLWSSRLIVYVIAPHARCG